MRKDFLPTFGHQRATEDFFNESVIFTKFEKVVEVSKDTL